MKTCPNCRYLNNDDNIICVQCNEPFRQNVPKGGRVEQQPSQPEPPVAPTPKPTPNPTPIQKPTPAPTPKPKKFSFSKIVIGAVVLVVAFGVVFSFALGSKNDEVDGFEITRVTDVGDNMYIFPTDEELLTYNILSRYTEEEIGYICNEMYARHGYIFNKEKYKTYFENKSWYWPLYNSMEYVVTLFNDCECTNLQIIADYRIDMGWQTPEEHETVGDNYIFPSDEEFLSYDILSNYTEEEIDYLCNEMYARHGYIFKKEKYIAYFSGKNWYVPRHDSMEYVVTLFNEFEKVNLQIIADYREYMGL